MDNRKQQPFYVGQRVVCVKDHSEKIITKGQVFRVVGLASCRCSTNIKINKIGRKPRHQCFVCGTLFSNDTFHHSLFAPYDPPAIEIPAELLKEPVEERSDAPVWKEVICDNGQSFLLTPQPNP